MWYDTVVAIWNVSLHDSSSPLKQNHSSSSTPNDRDKLKPETPTLLATTAWQHRVVTELKCTLQRKMPYVWLRIERGFCLCFLLLIQASSIGPSLENSNSDKAPFFTEKTSYLWPVKHICLTAVTKSVCIASFASLFYWFSLKVPQPGPVSADSSKLCCLFFCICHLFPSSFKITSWSNSQLSWITS